jgi:hypothetical protein
MQWRGKIIENSTIEKQPHIWKFAMMLIINIVVTILQSYFGIDIIVIN